MFNTKRILVAAVALATLVSFAVAANVVGTWNGKIILDTSSMPKPQNPQQKKALDDALAQIAKAKVVLKLNANKTFTIAATGMGKAPSQNAEGTYKVSRNQVILTATKENGKPASEQTKKPQTLQLSADGKTLTLAPPGKSGGKIVFRR